MPGALSTVLSDDGGPSSQLTAQRRMDNSHATSYVYNKEATKASENQNPANTTIFTPQNGYSVDQTQLFSDNTNLPSKENSYIREQTKTSQHFALHVQSNSSFNPTGVSGSAQRRQGAHGGDGAEAMPDGQIWFGHQNQGHFVQQDQQIQDNSESILQTNMMQHPQQMSNEGLLGHQSQLPSQSSQFATQSHQNNIFHRPPMSHHQQHSGDPLLHKIDQSQEYLGSVAAVHSSQRTGSGAGESDPHTAVADRGFTKRSAVGVNATFSGSGSASQKVSRRNIHEDYMMGKGYHASNPSMQIADMVTNNSNQR